MAADLQDLPQSIISPSPTTHTTNTSSSSSGWMWQGSSGGMQQQAAAAAAVVQDNEDDSWEVKAFEEDTTGNIFGATWPPRSYTCTFCRREFRSAQALGGHMNVHRRDRARLHRLQAPDKPVLLPSPSSPYANNSPFIVQNPQELISNGGGGGVCFFYSLPSNNDYSNPSTGVSNPPSNLVTVSSPLLRFPSCPNTPSPAATMNSVTPPPSIITNPVEHNNHHEGSGDKKHSSLKTEDEIDLELRLGCRSSPS